MNGGELGTMDALVVCTIIICQTLIALAVIWSNNRCDKKKKEE